MGYHEKKWLDDCPVQFKPLHYRRYVDDTFLIFKDHAHVELFLNYLNSKHPNIKFTSEIESDNKISFLDVLIERENGYFSTSVFRKKTYTGLGLNYLSFSAHLFKVNSIGTLINRAYNICSDYRNFHTEMMFLHDYFLKNSYPSYLFFKVLRFFLDKKHVSQVQKLTVNKDVRYIRLPYIGKFSLEVKNKLQAILRNTYPQIKFQFIFCNNFTLGSFLRNSSFLPQDLRSSVVYLFTCPQCALRYVGSTSRWLKHRTLEHKGQSIRTKQPLTKPSFSAIREHSLNEDHPYTSQDFTILAQTSDKLDLLISESLYIEKMRPQLNSSLSAFPLLTR